MKQSCRKAASRVWLYIYHRFSTRLSPSAAMQTFLRTKHQKMDPVSAIGLVGAIIGVVDVISRNISTLKDLQSRYKIAGLKVSLLIGQLSTLQAAFKQIVELMNTSIIATFCYRQLVDDLKASLDCCEAVILLLEERLSALRRGEDNGLDAMSRAQFVWDEKNMTDYLNLLSNQINAFNLLLTALQWLDSFHTPTPVL
jgi:hypothetical protein